MPIVDRSLADGRIATQSRGRSERPAAIGACTGNGNKHKPYVNIQVTREGVTSEQKQRLILGITDLLTTVLDKPAHTTHIVIQEIETDNWGVGGRPVTALRREQLRK